MASRPHLLRPTNTAVSGEKRSFCIRSAPRRRWVLNIPLLLLTLAVLGIGSPAVYFWHRYQIVRSAAALLDRSKRQQEESNFDGAVKTLFKYLSLRPDDVEARIRLAKLGYQHAKTASQKLRAVQLHARAIALMPDGRFDEKTELRCEHMSLVLDTGDAHEARALAEKLLSEDRARQGHPQALRVKALAILDLWQRQSMGSIGDVATALEQALEAVPGDVRVATNLAQLWRDEISSPPDAEIRGQKADEIMDHMVEASAEKDDAFLARSLYRHRYALAGADEDLQRALRADEKATNLGLILNAGSWALDQEDWAAAERHFRRLIELAPLDSKGYLGLGIAIMQQDQTERALDVWSEGISRTDDAQLLLRDRIVGAYIALQRWDAARKSLDVYRSRMASIPPAELPAAASRLARREAECAFAKGDYAAAIPLWQRVITQESGGAKSKEKSEELAEYYLRLAYCFEQLGEYDQAAVAFQQAADRRATRADLQFAAAAAWGNAGRYDLAVRMFHVGLDLDRSEKAPWISYVEAVLRLQAARLKKERDWREFEEALASAKQRLPAAVPLRVLEADYHWLQGRAGLATELLREAEKGARRADGLVQRFVLSYERWGANDQANRLASELRSEQPDSVATLVMDMDLSYARGDFTSARQRLQSALPNLTDQDRRSAKIHGIELDIGYGNLNEARDALSELAQDGNLPPRLLHAQVELALVLNDIGEVDAAIERLRARRGADGTYWRFYLAQRLLLEAAQTQERANDKLAEAVELQAQLEEMRPNWSSAKLLKARLLLLQRPPDEEGAINAYRRAIDLGERRSQVLEELISLLCRQGRLSEADHYLDRLRDVDSMSPTVAAMAMAIDVQQGKLSRAIELARAECQRSPESSVAHLRFGRLLMLDNTGDEVVIAERAQQAEAELKQARDLAPGDVGVWTALAQFYLQVQRPSDARSLLASFIGTKESQTPEGWLLLAQAYAALGDREEADSHFTKLLAAAPNDTKVCVAAASFYLASDLDRAQTLLQRAVDLDPKDASAVRMLAGIIAARGADEQDLNEVSRLLQSVEVDEASQVSNRRLQAILLLRKGGSKLRQEAKQLLEYVTAKDGVAPLDRLLLARIYEAQAQAHLARQQLQALTEIESPKPEHLATYLEFLLRIHPESTSRAEIEAEAQKLLHTLASLEPDEKHLRTISLRVRWLKALGRESDAADAIDGFAQSNMARARTVADQAEVSLAVANLYASAGMRGPAEKLFRQALSLNPGAFAAYAAWLKRDNRPHEAIELCAQTSSEPHQLLNAAKSLAGILIEADASDADRQLAHSVIQEALAQHNDDIPLLCSVSSLRLVEHDEAEAIRLLERAVEIDPRNLHALNNLAVLLSEKPSTRQRALEYANRAISIAGLSPELADTKGWTLLMQGKAAEAESMFEEAIAADPRHKRYYFHLAVTEHALGDMASARQHLEQAKMETLAGEVFTQEERSRLDQLNASRQ